MVGVRVTVGVGVIVGVRVTVGVNVLVRVAVAVRVGEGVTVTTCGGVGVTFPAYTNRTASAPTSRPATVSLWSWVRLPSWTYSSPSPVKWYLPTYTQPSDT
jgi:hypothetical protein